eukprot:3939494-Pleurochrysis_carterae.AAC.2
MKRTVQRMRGESMRSVDGETGCEPRDTMGGEHHTGREWSTHEVSMDDTREGEHTMTASAKHGSSRDGADVGGQKKSQFALPKRTLSSSQKPLRNSSKRPCW